MAPTMNIRSWKVFKALDPTFIADIRMAMVVGHGEAGIMVMRNDDVFSIGSSDEQLLGVKGKTTTKVPLKITQLSGTKIKGIYSGYRHVVVLTENGQLFIWGDISYGRLGRGEDTTARVPTRLHLPNDEWVTQVACGDGHTLALTDSGNVYSWGNNEDGQVSKGLGDGEGVWTPVDVLNEDGHGRNQVTSVACGKTSSFALRSNGQVWTWGRDLLKEERRIVGSKMVPLNFKVTKIVCGDENVLVLDTDDGLHFWGSYGDLQKFVSKPTKVALAGERVLDIAATWHSSLNVFSTESGTYFWGMWRGKCKTRPSVGNSTCMETMFAMDKDDFHGSIMCRPVVLIPQGEELLQTGFSEQFNQPATSDVHFQMRGGRLIHAHRVVLTSRSQYFHDKLDGPMDMVQMADDVDPEGFHSYLYYVYMGRMEGSILEPGPNRLQKVLGLLKTSHRFGQMDLFTECKNVLMKLVDAGNAPEMVRVAKDFKIKDLEDRTLELLPAPKVSKLVPTDAEKLTAPKVFKKRAGAKGLTMADQVGENANSSRADANQGNLTDKPKQKRRKKC